MLKPLKKYIYFVTTFVSNCQPTCTESFLSSLGKILYVYTHFWYLWLKKKMQMYVTGTGRVSTVKQSRMGNVLNEDYLM